MKLRNLLFPALILLMTAPIFSQQKTDLLKEKEKRIWQLMGKKQFDEALSAVDSLLAADLSYFQLYNWKSDVYLQQKKFDKALPNLQLAQKNAHDNYQISKAYRNWAIYLGQTGKIELGLDYLEKEKALMQDSTSYIPEWFENEEFAPLRKHPRFWELTDTQYLYYKARNTPLEKITDFLEFDYLILNETNHSNILLEPFYPTVEMIELMKTPNVKEVTITDKSKYKNKEDRNREMIYYFSKEGGFRKSKKTVSRLGDLSVREWMYDENSRIIQVKSYVILNDSIVSIPSKTDFEYDEKGLLKIIRQEYAYLGGPEYKNQLWRVERNPKNPNVVKVIEGTDEIGGEIIRTYHFNSDEKLQKFTGQTSEDVVNIEYVYEPDGISFKKIVRINDLLPSLSYEKKYDSFGRLIKDTTVHNPGTYEYDEKGRLIKMTQKPVIGNAYLTEYKYKDGRLVQKKSRFDLYKKFTFIKAYDYSFYE